MIALSAPTFDPLGHILIDELPDSDMGAVRRRGSRVSTLGPEGAVAQDRGHFASDRTFEITWRAVSRDQFSRVKRLVEMYSRVRVATDDGFFVCWPQSLRMQDDSDAGLTLLVLEKIA